MKILKNYFYKEHLVPNEYEKYFAGLWEFSIKKDLLERKWGFNSFHLPNLSICSVNGNLSVDLNGSYSHKNSDASYGGTTVNVFEFKPYLLKPVFGVTSQDILFRSVPLSNLNNSLISESEILSWLGESFEKNYCILGDILKEIDPPRDDKIISRAVDDFIDSKGILKPGCYIENLPVSERQFQRRFKKETGLSAMNFLKNVKLSCLSRELLKNDFKDNSIVFDYGYFDHPHYIRDFKGFHGYTPLNYRNRIKVVNFDLP